MRWRKGEDVMQRLLTEGALEPVRGAAADGSQLLESAQRLLESAARELQENPEAAFVLAYDGARKSCAALLAQQGLRTRSAGHHVTTEQVVRAQFGGPFTLFGSMRRRRIEIEYPRFPGEDVSVDEAREALSQAQDIHLAASQLLGELGLFNVER